MSDRPFDFGCSTLPFGALAYSILTRQGYHLDALLRGEAAPRSLAEGYFVRCVREDADYDSHQCVEADAWRQLVERRAFERDYPPPGPDRTWVRAFHGWNTPTEFRPGEVLYLRAGPTLVIDSPRYETRGTGGRQEFRHGPELPWHRIDDGFPHPVKNLRTGAVSELWVKGDELFEAADGLGREMTYVWRNRRDDVLVLDTDTDEPYHVPPDRVSRDIPEAALLHPYSRVRVQWWDGEPLWVWGPA